MNKLISKAEVFKSINPHLLTILPISENYESYILPPSDLLCAARFDVMSKYIYGKLTRLGVAQDWRLHVYLSLQKIFGFMEGDGSGKNSQLEYLNRFEEILESITTNGFREEIGLLPIDRHHVIIDGAHRLAASLLDGCPVSIVKFDFDAPKYNYEYFEERGLPFDVADSMALEFCRLAENMVVAVLFPVAIGREDDVRIILSEYGQVVYSTEVVFSKIGRYNFIRQLYRGESWLGVDGEMTAGLLHHVEERFSGNRPVKFFFVMKSKNSDIRDAKIRIRDLFGMQNDSIHINDTHEETVRLAEQILLPNSIHFLNHAQPWLSKKFLSMFCRYKEEIITQKLNKDNFCIDSGAVLAAYGLRDTNDLDYLHFEGDLNLPLDSNINGHNEELKYHDLPVGDILFDPYNYFYYDGMKFISLPQLRKMKTKRNEPKDIKDILLIDSLVSGETMINDLYRRFRYSMRMIYQFIIRFRLWQLKYLIPESLRPIAKRIYHTPFYFKERFGSLERQMRYKGFKLWYSKGASLIYRIHTGETYEPELTWRVLEELKKHSSPIFLDIGSNIGLITLNVLAAFSNARVFAFEPGPHQYSLLQKTIIENNLQGKVTLSNHALSFEKGETYFSIHRSKDSSGDGFFDTGRAGRTEKIRVPVTTLDQWWLEMGEPHIHVVKIDAEGAEYWILQGALRFLNETRPLVFLEINEKNLRVYPYDMEDIVTCLEQCNYKLHTLTGNAVDTTRVREIANTTEMFVAFPL